jgi:hypothetical protein
MILTRFKKNMVYLDDAVFTSSIACGRTTFGATAGRLGTSQLNSAVAVPAPNNCATMKPSTSAGRMPLKVSVAALARVTAGLANDVDAVNQYAAVMYAPTAKGTTDVRSREQPQITESKPKVAINSLNICDAPLRLRRDAESKGNVNIA